MDQNLGEMQSFSAIVLDYLKLQEPAKPEADALSEIVPTSKQVAEDVLNDLLENFEKCERLKEEYEFKVRNHNQYQLFNLREQIKDFNIDDALYRDLTYRETLVVGRLTKEYLLDELDPCGGCCLDIQRARGREPLRRITPDLFKAEVYKKFANKLQMDYDRDVRTEKDLEQYGEDLKQNLEQEFTKFLIHYSCKFNVNGYDCGERITSWVDKNFHTLEESRTEFIETATGIHTKKLYVSLNEGRYFVKNFNSLNKCKESKYYSLQKMKKYVSEGANFLLMRYMAVTRFVGSLEMSCVYINGDMCLNAYNCLGPESGTFNMKKLDVCRIYRTVIEECGLTHQSLTVVTLVGQMLRHEWKNMSYILYINPKAVVRNAKPRGNVRILLQKDWRNDLQLYSTFLDAKMENKMHATSYLADHQEIHNLLADYVQQILQIKPTNVVEFTVNYFSTHAPKYFEKFKFTSFNWGEHRD